MKFKLSFLLFVYTVLEIYRNVLLGGMPFWYDPARDLTLAGAMFSKFSFLGQPSGIPGFYYPPYWLWLLFLLLHLSRDPALVTLLGISLPYVALFPLGLWFIRKEISSAGVFLFLTIFISKFDNYVTQLWNLNLAPLILLWIFVAYQRKWSLLLGVLSVLLLAFDFALGVPVIIATFVLLLVTGEISLPFLAGLGLTLSPTIAFEIKNRLTQTKILWQAAFSRVVNEVGGQKISGLSKLEIGQRFIPGAGLIIWTAFFQKISRLQLFLAINLLAIFFVFIRNSNPIWPYHFLGLEMIYLLFLFSIMASTLEKFAKPVLLLTAVFLAIKILVLLKTPADIYNFDNLTTRKELASFVLSDQKKMGETCGFATFGRTPFERSYENEYLLSLISQSQHLPLPKINSNEENCVYVAFPRVTDNQLESYLNGVTPVGVFGTAWKKSFASGLTVVLRQRHERI